MSNSSIWTPRLLDQGIRDLLARQELKIENVVSFISSQEIIFFTTTNKREKRDLGGDQTFNITIWLSFDAWEFLKL